jgi:hypothetical protein
MKLQAPGKLCAGNHTVGHSLRPPRRATTTPAPMRPQHGGDESRLRFTSWMATRHFPCLSSDPGELSRSSWGGPRVDEADRSPPLGGTKRPLDPAASRR